MRNRHIFLFYIFRFENLFPQTKLELRLKRLIAESHENVSQFPELTAIQVPKSYSHLAS